MNEVLIIEDDKVRQEKMEVAYKSLREIVGGGIEMVTLTPDVGVYIHHEGAYSLPVNTTATKVAASMLLPERQLAGPLHGPAVFVGLDDDRDDHVDLPQKAIDEILGITQSL